MKNAFGGVIHRVDMTEERKGKGGRRGNKGEGGSSGYLISGKADFRARKTVRDKEVDKGVSSPGR